MVVRPDDASCTSEAGRAGGLELDDEDAVLPGGAGQRAVRRGGGRQPSTRSSPRCGTASAPTRSVAATGEEIAALIAWGQRLREPAGRPADGADRVPRRHLPARTADLDATSGSWSSPSTPPRWTGSSGSWPSAATGRAPSWRRSRARRRPRSGRTSGPGSPRRRTSSRCGSWSPPTPPARASTCRPTATGW